MNKEKFEKKVQEVYAYEYEMLAKMNEIIKPYNEELNKQGYEIVCKLNWESEMQSDDEFMLTERPKIIKHKGYRCLLFTFKLHHLKNKFLKNTENHLQKIDGGGRCGMIVSSRYNFSLWCSTKVDIGGGYNTYI